MKGIVFVKFNEFVEETFGEECWEEILDEVNPDSEGAYISVGTFPDEELFALVTALINKHSLTMAEGQRAFGQWLFKELLNVAPDHARHFKDVFTFLHGVEDVIHVEVKKLNPDAILPQFKFLEESENHISLQYISPRKMCFFCEGLIQGLAEYLAEPVTIEQPECEHERCERCVIKVTKI